MQVLSFFSGAIIVSFDDKLIYSILYFKIMIKLQSLLIFKFHLTFVFT